MNHVQGIKILSEGQVGRGLLVESDAGIITHDLNRELIKEDMDLKIQGSTIFINCILQKAGVLNRNGRIYPRHILERELKKYSEKIDGGNALGQINHPDSLTIELGQTPHRLVKYWWEGDTAMGKLEIFLTKGYIQMGICSTVGDQIAELLRHKVKIGISSRGLGSVKKIRGANLVQDDFELVCFDLVESPSTPNAYLFQDTTSLNESHTTVLNSTLEHKLKNFIQL